MTKQDWEHLYLKDRLYIEETEYLEIEALNKEQKPAKITIKIEKENGKISNRRNRKTDNTY